MSNNRRFQFYCVECKHKWESGLSHKWRTLYCPNCFDKSGSKTHIIRREILSVFINFVKRRKNVYTCLTCFKSWNLMSKKSKLEDFLKCPKQCGFRKKKKKRKKKILSPGSVIPGNMNHGLKLNTSLSGKKGNKRKRQFSPVEEKEIQSVREFLYSLPHGMVSKNIEIIHDVDALQKMVSKHQLKNVEEEEKENQEKSTKVVILLSDEIEKIEKMNRKMNFLKREIEAKDKIIEEFREFVYQENESKIERDREVLNLQMELMLLSSESDISELQSSSNRQESSSYVREIKELKRTERILREKLSEKNEQNSELLELKRKIIQLESENLDLRNEKKHMKNTDVSNVIDLQKKVDAMEYLLTQGVSEDEVKQLKQRYESEIKSREIEITRLKKVSEKYKKYEDKFICGICLDNQIDLCLSCGHSLCQECAKKMKKCPFCRKVINAKINLYL